MVNRRVFCRHVAAAAGAIATGQTVAAVTPRRSSLKPAPLSFGELQHLAGTIAANTRYGALLDALTSSRRHAYTLYEGDPAGPLYLKFVSPVPAMQLCRAFGWMQPYAVSQDVHQNSWYIRFRGVDLPDPYGPRISVKTPVLGHWAVDAVLTHRPPGPLPLLSAGASPAYDLSARPVGCEMLTIRPFHPDDDS